MEYIIWLIGSVIAYIILYFVIKTAVRDGLKEAFNKDDTNDEDVEAEGYSINKVICQGCGEKYDIDYPKCPYCNHLNSNLN